MKKTTGKTNNPVSNCLLIVANRNTRKRCDICSNLAIKTVERRHVNGVILMSLSLTLNLFYTFSGRSLAGGVQGIRTPALFRYKPNCALKFLDQFRRNALKNRFKNERIHQNDVPTAFSWSFSTLL